MLSLLRRLNPVPNLPVEVAGLRFPNPVGLAAGFDKDARLIPALASLGFGFIEVGTFTRLPQAGNPSPRLFRYPEAQALVNRLGFNNCGADEAARRLSGLERPVPVGISIGKSAAAALEDAPKEYAQTLQILHECGEFFVLNISSPNTAELRRLNEPDRLRALLDEVATVLERRGRKPLFLKVSPDTPEPELASTARLAVDFEAGGLSGAPLRERSTAVLKRLRELTEGRVPLIGVGGILSVQDARDKFASGADLIEVFTGIVYRGPDLIRQIVEDLALNGIPTRLEPLPQRGGAG